MEIEAAVDLIEIDGKAAPIDGPKLVLRSHWNHDEWVVLEFAGKKITVKSSDLDTARMSVTRWRNYS